MFPPGAMPTALRGHGGHGRAARIRGTVTSNMPTQSSGHGSRTSFEAALGEQPSPASAECFRDGPCPLVRALLVAVVVAVALDAIAARAGPGAVALLTGLDPRHQH